MAKEAITFADFKKCINKSNYKFFFQSYDEDFGLVKEEISDDKAILPQTQEGKIVCFLTPCEKVIFENIRNRSNSEDFKTGWSRVHSATDEFAAT